MYSHLGRAAPEGLRERVMRRVSFEVPPDGLGGDRSMAALPG